MQRSRETLESIPEIKTASPLAQEELTTLLREAHTLRAAEKRLKEIKPRIAQLILENGLSNGNGINGARDGKLGVIISHRNGKRYLNATLLIEAGVTPGQIRAGTITGKDSDAVELFEIGASWEPEE